MKEPIPYLSNDALNELIKDTELSGTAAPPGLEEAVWQRLEEQERTTRLAPRRKKRTPAEELRRYRLQVAASVAAAIWLLFTAPAWGALFPEKPGRDGSGAVGLSVTEAGSAFDILEIIGGRQ